MNIPSLFDLLGRGGTLAAVFLNIKHWLVSENASLFLTIVISILVVVYWVMKIYDQFLITKKRKKDEQTQEDHSISA